MKRLKTAFVTLCGSMSLVACGQKLEGTTWYGSCPKGEFEIFFVGKSAAKVSGTTSYSIEYEVEKDLVRFKANGDIVTGTLRDGTLKTDESSVNIGGCTFTQQKPKSVVPKPPPLPLPSISFSAKDIDGITLKSKTNAEVKLTKTGNAWNLGSDVALQSPVDEVLAAAATCTVKDSLGAGKDALASYDLDGDKAIHLVLKKGETVALDLYLGRAGNRGQTGRVGGDDRAVLIGGCSAFAFDKAPKDFRNRGILTLDKASIVGVDLVDRNGTFKFASATTGWNGTLDGKPIAGLKSAAVDDLISAFTLGGQLNAEGFADGKSDADTGLTAAEATTITFHLKAGGDVSISLGKAEGAKRYARKSGSPTVYLLGPAPAGWADVGAEKFAAKAP